MRTQPRTTMVCRWMLNEPIAGKGQRLLRRSLSSDRAVRKRPRCAGEPAQDRPTHSGSGDVAEQRRAVAQTLGQSGANIFRNLFRRPMTTMRDDLTQPAGEIGAGRATDLRNPVRSRCVWVLTSPGKIAASPQSMSADCRPRGSTATMRSPARVTTPSASGGGADRKDPARG